jgi:hypothetical protein
MVSANGGISQDEPARHRREAVIERGDLGFSPPPGVAAEFQ